MITHTMSGNLIASARRYKFHLVARYLTLGQRDITDRELTSEIKHKIEAHWKGKLCDNEHAKEASAKESFYVLSMFPYPSGNLHMGHVRVYSISDSMARFHRLNGKRVLHPMGWDAFGLPAENAALQRNIPAADWTRDNIAHMKKQLELLGASFDWTREFATCEPEYYRWTQDLFIKLFDNGLAYQEAALVNWDPVDKTVLAEEQVDANGRSWRSGAKVEKKLLRQWFIRTTQFAKQLYEGLQDLNREDWKDIIKIQKHWIGECNGYAFDLEVVGGKGSDSVERINVWTECPEQLSGLNCFIALKNAHILNKTDQTEFLSDLRVWNPFTNAEIPIIFTDTVAYPVGRSGSTRDVYLGTAHIDNDIELSIRFNLPKVGEDSTHNSEERRRKVLDKAQELNIGGYPISSKLQDWLISRQRKWGTPIPIIHCDDCGPVPDRSLPVLLESLTAPETACPNCQRPARRETDTMDTFVDSSWYFLRFLDPHNSGAMFDPELAHKQMPVDLYIGGKEHAELHLYYARFIGHFLHSQHLLPQPEPFKRLLVQGMVMGRSFKQRETGKYLSEHEVEVVDAKKNKAVEIGTGKPVTMAWEKMSKSKMNGVDPAAIIGEYGCDTTRLFILGNVAPVSHRNWTTDTFPGILNWQKRIWLTISDLVELRTSDVPCGSDKEFEEQERILWDSRNYYVSGATFHFKHTQHISSAISNMQGLTNFIRRAPKDVICRGSQFEWALASQLIMLAPLAPHFASECWSRLALAPNRVTATSPLADWSRDVLEQRWPEVDQDFGLDLTVYLNGVELTVIKIPRREIDQLREEDALSIALAHSAVMQGIGSNELKHGRYKSYPGCQGDLYLSVKRPPKQMKEAL